jgi:hypothetical protein
MGQVPRAVAFLVLLSAAARPASAQSESSSPPLLPSTGVAAAHARPATAPDLIDDHTADYGAEAEQWVRDYTAWKDWSDQWRNRRQPGWFTGYKDRRDAPIPPPWLADRCTSVLEDSDPLMQACTLLREWTDGFAATQLRTANASAVAQKEDESNTTWWEHLHVDLLWPAMQWRTSMYGVIGMHAATTVKGRFQAFVAPGMMVLNLPSRSGARTWKVAANYGIGYRLFDFVFPGGRLASLHVNAARAWVVSDVTDVVTGRTVDFAGFSVTFKKNP